MKRRSSVGASGAAASVVVGLPLRALAQATQGVTKDEVLVGTIQDLSGPTVANSKPGLNGMTLRVEQINAAGGINGRKIKFLVEDSVYDPKRGVLAAQKLVTNHRVFAMVGVFGTPVALAPNRKWFWIARRRICVRSCVTVSPKGSISCSIPLAVTCVKRRFDR